MLTSEQARQNQEKYGFNELVEGKKKKVSFRFFWNSIRTFSLSY